MIEKIIIFIMGSIFGTFFNSIGKDMWSSLKRYIKLIKEYIILFIKTKKIYNDYQQLKENNEKYKNQIKQYNIFHELCCREYYINQIKEKYGEELCTPEILQKYWLDDHNNWNLEIKYNGNIYQITSIGLDTYNKNIWKSFGPLKYY